MALAEACQTEQSRSGPAPEWQPVGGRSDLTRTTNHLVSRARSQHSILPSSAGDVRKSPGGDATFSTDAPESPVVLSGSTLDEQEPCVSAVRRSPSATLQLLMQERSRLLMRISSKLGVAVDTAAT